MQAGFSSGIYEQDLQAGFTGFPRVAQDLQAGFTRFARVEQDLRAGFTSRIYRIYQIFRMSGCAKGDVVVMVCRCGDGMGEVEIRRSQPTEGCCRGGVQVWARDRRG